MGSQSGRSKKRNRRLNSTGRLCINGSVKLIYLGCHELLQQYGNRFVYTYIKTKNSKYNFLIFCDVTSLLACDPWRAQARSLLCCVSPACTTLEDWNHLPVNGQGKQKKKKHKIADISCGFFDLFFLCFSLTTI